MTDQSQYDTAFDDAYDRLCEVVSDPHRVRVTVRAQDLRVVLTELVHRK
jgi:hypothetical protein